MKGRNTTCITIRLEDSVVKSLTDKAEKGGFRTPGEYIKAQILKNHSVNKSVITTGSAITTDKPDLTSRLESAGLKVDGNSVSMPSSSKSSPIEQATNTKIPLYNRRIHKQGDVVILGGQVVTVPELDMDGYPVMEG